MDDFRCAFTYIHRGGTSPFLSEMILLMKRLLLPIFCLLTACGKVSEPVVKMGVEANAHEQITALADSLTPVLKDGPESEKGLAESQENGHQKDEEPGENEQAFAQLSLPERLEKLLDNEIFERTNVGIWVYDLTVDKPVFSYNECQCLRPASNEKIVTSVTALEVLGSDYLYRTRLYASKAEAVNDSVWNGRLYIRGGYDPLFGEEDMRAFVRALKERGISVLTSRIGLDYSFKDDKRMGWGWCWDDDEVPLTPLLYNNRDTFVENLRRVMKDEGIEWDGTVNEASVPAEAEVWAERTHTLQEVLVPMMKKSDNSMAESVFYQIAASGGKPKATRKDAVRQVEHLIRKVHLNPDHYQIADGSGLSLYNYLTPQLVGYLLRYAYHHKHIYEALLPAMPIAGEDGTLRKRMKGTAAAGNVRAKTGTVEGVSTLSGYCTAANGHLLCFSIMNQGIRHTSTGRNFQDRVCRELCR